MHDVASARKFWGSTTMPPPFRPAPSMACPWRFTPGEPLTIVRESGPGKTVTTLRPLRLLPDGVAVDLRGSAFAAGCQVLGMDSAALSDLRDRETGVIPDR